MDLNSTFHSNNTEGYIPHTLTISPRVPPSPTERKVTSYHHYEEVERVVAEAVFRSSPLCSVPEESASEPPDVDLAVGGEQLYQNIPGSYKV